jgi:hypothetical protein
MSRKAIIYGAAAVMILLSLAACKRIYYHVSEEISGNKPNKFRIQEAYYQMGKSIAITGGRYELVPGDSIILFIQGQGTVTGVGEAGVATLDFPETTRFYISLPNILGVKTYHTGRRAICEITGNLNYGPGEDLFVCQSGKVVIDSLKGDKIYGNFSGKYLNTSNKSITVDGPFKAGLK